MLRLSERSPGPRLGVATGVKVRVTCSSLVCWEAPRRQQPGVGHETHSPTPAAASLGNQGHGAGIVPSASAHLTVQRGDHILESTWERHAATMG